MQLHPVKDRLPKGNIVVVMANLKASDGKAWH